MKEERNVFTRFGLSKIFSISNIIGFFVWGNKDIDPELVCNACYKSEKKRNKKIPSWKKLGFKIKGKADKEPGDITDDNLI